MPGLFLPHPVRLHPQTRELLGVDPRDNMTGWRPGQAYVWEKAVYTVPRDVAEERIQFTASKYRNRFGEALEKQGFEVLDMDGPYYDGSVVAIGTTDPDRKRYVIWARVRRRPVTERFEVPDEDVPIYEKAGCKLVS